MIETDFPELAGQLGLTRKQREEIKRMLPSARIQYQRTKISDEDAETLRRAAVAAAIGGVAVIIVLRLILSGAVTPNVP